MVRPASFDRNGIKSVVWSKEEDNKLRACIDRFGHSNWRLLPLAAGLKRCGKSCRLRWVNYLKPGLRRGNFTKDEEHCIIELHNQLGNKWSAMATYFPGRTDNDIKNYWHAHIQKRSTRGRVSREMMIQNQSLNNDSSMETGLNQGTIEGFNQNMGVFESNADSDYNAAALFQRCFSNLSIDHHNFVEKEFDYSDFWAEPISGLNHLKMISSILNFGEDD